MVRKNADDEEKKDPDADLTHLLASIDGEEQQPSQPTNGNGHTSTQGREQQHRHGHLSVDPFASCPPKARSSPRSGSHARSSPVSKCLDSIASVFRYGGRWINLACHYHPWCCGSLLIVVLLSIVLLIPSYLFNPTEVFGLSAYDEQQVLHIHSKYDLEMWKVDHWCLGGGDENCKCQDPLAPTPRLTLSNSNREKNQAWIQAWKRNRKIVQHYADMANDRSNNFAGLDVAFVGESVVEAMGGRWMGMQPTNDLKLVEAQFRQHFQSASSPFQGVALGIAGDTAPNVLWRLIQEDAGGDSETTMGGGELTTPGFEPSVFWLVLGSNDLARMQCSEEIVLLGILRVVEEILTRKPDAYIVINSILPMYRLRGGRDPYLSDINDTFRSTATIPPVPQQHYGGHRRLSFRSRNYAYQDPNPPDKKPLGQEKRPTMLKPLDEDLETNPDLLAEIKNRERQREDQHAREETQKRKKKFFGNNNKPQPWNPTYYGKPVTSSFRRKENIPDYQLDPAVKKMKKFRRGHFGRQQNHIPLFTSIDAINRALKAFARETDRVEFFDASDVFTWSADGTTAGSRKGRTGFLKKRPSQNLNTNRISVLGHPTVPGYKVWEDAIIRRLERIRRDQPELFRSRSTSTNDDAEDVFSMSHAFDDDDDAIDVYQLYGGVAADTAALGLDGSGFSSEKKSRQASAGIDINAYTIESQYGGGLGQFETDDDVDTVEDLSGYDVGPGGVVTASAGGGLP